MKIHYDVNSFVENFRKIVMDAFGVNASEANYIITPNYDPMKYETGEDSVFRLVILSEDNIGGRKFNFDDAVSVMTAFEAYYPTKVVITAINEEEPNLFEIKCSTRVRKSSVIAGIEKDYAPFVLGKHSPEKSESINNYANE